MNIPVVTFMLPPIKTEAHLLSRFTYNKKDGREKDVRWFVFTKHPELRTMLEGITDKKEYDHVCLMYAKQYRVKRTKEFRDALVKNERLWKPVEKKFITTLCKHFETPLPSKKKIMRAYVSMLPIYPRWIDTWSFNVSYVMPERVREIACHEILHFFYFQKWMEVFPHTKREEFDSPHLVWRLSEILDPVILSEHLYFKTLFDRQQKTYTHFQALRINGRQPATHYTYMYRRHLKSGNPFEEFLKEAWAFALKHKDVLMST